MGGWVHLARRFAGSLRPGGPPRAATAWAHAHLLPAEQALWDAMAGADRRHSVLVARRVVAELGTGTAREVVAAALLHDVGKRASGLGTFGRVAATLVGTAVSRGRTEAWRRRPRGRRRRIGDYLAHDAIGACELAAAGSHEVTVAWAREHHLAPDRWTVPAPLGAALAAADDD